MKLAAVRDPTLRAILDRLQLGPASAAEIARDLGLDDQAIRHLLRRLLKSGLIEREGKSRRRGVSEFLYSSDARRSQLSPDELSKLPPEQAKAAVARVLRILYRETMAAIDSGSLERAEAFATRFPLPLDDAGWLDALRVHEQLLGSIVEAAERAKSRPSSREEEPIETTAAILFFEIPHASWPLPFAEGELPPGPVRTSPDRRRLDTAVAYLDPLRLKIIDALTLGPASAIEIAEAIRAPLDRVRYELRAFEKAAMIVVHSQRERRGALEKVFVADSRKLTIFTEDIPSGGEDLPTAYSAREWDARWARRVFGEAVDGIRGDSFHERVDWQVVRTPFRLDAQGFVEISASMDAALERLFDLRKECLHRLEEDASLSRPALSTFLLFERSQQMLRRS